MMLIQIQQIPPTPDPYFWYAVAGLLLLGLVSLSALVISILKSYASKTEDAIEKLVESSDNHGNELIRIATRQEFNERRIVVLENNTSTLADQIVTKIKAMNGD